MLVSGFLESIKQLIRKGGFLQSPSGHGGQSLGKMTSMVLVAAIFLTTSQSHSRISLSFLLPFSSPGSSPFVAILNSWQLSSTESQGRPEAAEFPAREKTCWRKDSGAGGATCYTQELSYIVPFTPPVKARGRAAHPLSLHLLILACTF